MTGSLHPGVIDLCRDRQRGATALLQDFMEIVDDLNVAELDANLQALQQAFPVMACWYFLKRRFLQDKIAVNELRTELGQARQEAIREAQHNLVGIKTLLTISHSSLLVETLITLATGERPAVIVGKGLPAGEGNHMHENLLAAGLDVELVEDWELVDRVPHVDLVMTGADVVSGDGFVNKQGTGELTVAAWQTGVPFRIVAEAFKYIPDWQASPSAYYQRAPQGHRQKVFEWVAGTIKAGLWEPGDQ